MSAEVRNVVLHPHPARIAGVLWMLNDMCDAMRERPLTKQQMNALLSHTFLAQKLISLKLEARLAEEIVVDVMFEPTDLLRDLPEAIRAGTFDSILNGYAETAPAEQRTRIPPSYRPAEWRCTLPVDPDTGRIAIAFDTFGANPIRLSLSIESAMHLSETIADYVSRFQPDKSSGSPTVDVSGIPSAGSVWPPAKSSRACSGEE